MERDDLRRSDVPPNPWFAQRVINNAFLAERPLPFWQSLWRDLNAEFPIPQPAVALMVMLVFGFLFGAATQTTPDTTVDSLYTQNVLYETRGVL